MEAMAFTGLLGFLQPMIGSKKPELRKITEKELENVREQKRLVEDAARVQKMLYISFQTAMKNIETKYKLPEGSSIDFSNGEIMEAKSDG